MLRLSVNINKIATLRNARGGDIPNVVRVAVDCQSFGAHGITVHPRPDERHIRYKDVRDLKPVITTELNIEGYPTESFIRLVMEVNPHQVTLVPDPPEAVTSSAGWDTQANCSFLRGVVRRFSEVGIRTSIFVDANTEMVKYAADTGTNRVELYTEPYAARFPQDPEGAIEPFLVAANTARSLGLDLNAGHDLNLDNVGYLARTIPWVKEVSIGHALIAEALYFGLENTIQMYLHKLDG